MPSKRADKVPVQRPPYDQSSHVSWIVSMNMLSCWIASHNLQIFSSPRAFWLLSMGEVPTTVPQNVKNSTHHKLQKIFNRIQLQTFGAISNNVQINGAKPRRQSYPITWSCWRHVPTKKATLASYKIIQRMIARSISCSIWELSSVIFLVFASSNVQQVVSLMQVPSHSKVSQSQKHW